MEQKPSITETARICKELRKIAQRLEGNKNAEIQAFFIKVVNQFADDNVLYLDSTTFGNDFVEWQIIERKESDNVFYESAMISVENVHLYLQKTCLDSSTQPVEIAKIPTNFSFSEMINFCTHVGLIDNLPCKFGIQSKLFEYYFKAIKACTYIAKKQEIIFEGRAKCYDSIRLFSWEIFEINENPYVKKVQLGSFLAVKETIQVSQIPNEFSLQELVNYCLFLGIVN